MSKWSFLLYNLVTRWRFGVLYLVMVYMCSKPCSSKKMSDFSTCFKDILGYYHGTGQFRQYHINRNAVREKNIWLVTPSLRASRIWNVPYRMDTTLLSNYFAIVIFALPISEFKRLYRVNIITSLELVHKNSIQASMTVPFLARKPLTKLPKYCLTFVLHIGSG